MPLLIALVAALGQAPAPELVTFSGRVVAVADGDTLTVLRDRTEVKIRLHGIDAPESGQDFAPGCRSIPRILPTNRLVFTTEADARKAGFKPAKDCP